MPSWVVARSIGSGSAELSDLRIGQAPHRFFVAVCIVANHNEAVVGVVPLVKVRRPSRAIVPDRAPDLERRKPLLVRRHHSGAGRAIPNLDNPGIDGGPVRVLSGGRRGRRHDGSVGEGGGGGGPSVFWGVCKLRGGSAGG